MRLYDKTTFIKSITSPTILTYHTDQEAALAYGRADRDHGAAEDSAVMDARVEGVLCQKGDIFLICLDSRPKLSSGSKHQPLPFTERWGY